MPVPLLQTKLFIPQLQPNLVPRPGLLRRLSLEKSRKLTLVSAPAGFGKTTLLVDWIRSEKIPFAWITLDENDNDIGRFLAYLIESLGTIQIPVDPQLPNLLGAPDKISLKEVIVPIINQILRNDRQFGLVLDDYHLIQHEEIHNALAYLLDYLPSNMHLVIASRADPPLNLAKLRANGQMNEIRISHLRFSIAQANYLLNQLRGLNLTSEDLHGLITRTDGWIAGLQMASLALEGVDDPTQYILDFSGNQEYIADYLTSEVFARQPDTVQEFLLKTSILDRLNASLCDAVTEQENGKDTLKYLKEKNLFLWGLDDGNQWYRYHRLFADLNYQRLLERHADQIAYLYQKASTWFEINGFLSDAIDYAFRGNHMDRAAGLIEVEAEPTLLRSEIASFVNWVEKLPEEIIYRSESLCIYYSWTLLVNFDEPQKAEKFIKKVVPTDDQSWGRVNTVKAMIAVHQREIDQAIHLASSAIELLPSEDHFFRNVAAWNLSALLFISGDTEGGAKMLEEVAKVSLAGDNLLVAIIALCRLGSLRYQNGELELAKSLFQQAIGIKPPDQTEPLPAACEAMFGLGKVYWEYADYNTASQYLQEGIQLSKRWREITDIDSYLILARIYLYQGKTALADQLTHQAKIVVTRTTTTDTGRHYMASQEALLRLRKGDHAGVERWVSSRGFDEIIQGVNFEELRNQSADIVLRYELVEFSRYLIVTHKIDNCLHLLGKLLPSLERLGHQAKIHEARVLKALGLQAIGEIDMAVFEMTALLASAEKRGYKRIFVDEGQEMTRLIQTAMARGYHSQFAEEVLSLFTDKGSDDLPRDVGIDLIEPLSDREIEVLRLLDSTLSVPEIADHLFIAVSTLRTHVRNIYRKLGVHSRFEAVSEGKDLKIT